LALAWHWNLLPHLPAIRWAYHLPRTYGHSAELLDETRRFELTDIKREIAAGRAPGAAESMGAA
jgi:hypothetical protein